MVRKGDNLQRIRRWEIALFGANAPTSSLRMRLTDSSDDESARLLRAYELDDVREATEDAAQLGWGVQRYVLRATTSKTQDLGRLPRDSKARRRRR